MNRQTDGQGNRARQNEKQSYEQRDRHKDKETELDRAINRQTYKVHRIALTSRSALADFPLNFGMIPIIAIEFLMKSFVNLQNQNNIVSDF